MDCPQCGEECYRDEVDVGVGVIYGPWGCYCGWSEYPVRQAEEDHPGYYCDPWGGLTKVDVIVENAKRFGLDGDEVRKAFDRGAEE